MGRSILCIWGALALLGCGDDTTTDAGRDAAGPDVPQVDVGLGDVGRIDVASDVASGDATAADAGPTSDLSVLCTNRDGEAMEGVVLAFDSPDGTRVEGTTGADGRFTFSGIRFGDGADLTAVPPGVLQLAALSHVGLTEAYTATLLNDDGDLPMAFSFFNGEEETITVSGTLSGFDDVTNFFNVISPAATSQHFAAGAAYSLEVRPGEPLELTVMELAPTPLPPRGWDRVVIRVKVIESEALTEDTVIDIDMSESETLTAVSGSIPAPPDGHQLATMGRPFYRSISLGGGARGTLGVVGQMAVSDDGASFEYTGQRWSDGVNPATLFSINTGPLTSNVVVDGFGDGVQDAAFLDPAIVVTPAFGELHPLRDPVVITTVHDDVAVNMAVFDEAGFRWALLGPPGATELRIPALPASVTESDVLGDEALSGRVQLCDLDDELPNFCRRQALARTFDFMR